MTRINNNFLKEIGNHIIDNVYQEFGYSFEEAKLYKQAFENNIDFGAYDNSQFDSLEEIEDEIRNTLLENEKCKILSKNNFTDEEWEQILVNIDNNVFFNFNSNDITRGDDKFNIFVEAYDRNNDLILVYGDKDKLLELSQYDNNGLEIESKIRKRR